MKRKQKELLEKILEEMQRQSWFLEQIIRNQALLGCQNQRIHETINSWWGTDLKHHGEENNLIKKVLREVPLKTKK